MLPKNALFCNIPVLTLISLGLGFRRVKNPYTVNISQIKIHINKYLRLYVIFFYHNQFDQVKRNAYLTPYCHMLKVICLTDSSMKYLSNSTFRTSLAFQMNMQERLEKVNFCKNLRFGRTSKKKKKPCMIIFMFSSSFVNGEHGTWCSPDIQNIKKIFV